MTGQHANLRRRLPTWIVARRGSASVRPGGASGRPQARKRSADCTFPRANTVPHAQHSSHRAASRHHTASAQKVNTMQSVTRECVTGRPSTAKFVADDIPPDGWAPRSSESAHTGRTEAPRRCTKCTRTRRWSLSHTHTHSHARGTTHASKRPTLMTRHRAHCDPTARLNTAIGDRRASADRPSDDLHTHTHAHTRASHVSTTHWHNMRKQPEASERVSGGRTRWCSSTLSVPLHRRPGWPSAPHATRASACRVRVAAAAVLTAQKSSAARQRDTRHARGARASRRVPWRLSGLACGRRRAERRRGQKAKSNGECPRRDDRAF